MADHTNTKWVDLTDLLSWNGNVTGIQRVVYEYAKRFDRDGAKFFAYDKLGSRFIQLELDSLALSHVEPRTHGVTEENITVRRKLRRTIGKPYYMLSDSNKAVLRPLVDATNFYVRYGLSKVTPKSRVTKSPYEPMSGAVFGEGDTVILLGASWNDGTVLDRLIEIKQTIPFKLIQHINDLLPIYQPQLFSGELPGKFRPYVNKVIHHADVITVISEATKRDVIAYYAENEVENVSVKVVRLGEDIETEKPLRPEAVPKGRDFILAVGTFEVRKNYALLYQAVKLAQLENRQLPHIVIAGRKGWLTEDLIHMIGIDPFAKEHITWLPDATDNELSWLYDNCMLTVFPSIAEGWGLPVVESLQHGKMSLASGVSSMLEIGDGLVDYFLPYDARECMEKILFYISEDRYVAQNEKVKDGYIAYTWDMSYRALCKAIK